MTSYRSSVLPQWKLLWLVLTLGGCAAPGTPALENRASMTAALPGSAAADGYKWLNRLTWGASASSVDANAGKGFEAYLAQQLRPPATRLPESVNTQIQAMAISQQSMVALVQTLEQRNKDANALTDDDAKKAAQQSYQAELNRLGREAATRHILRDLYSPNQLQEQMCS